MTYTIEELRMPHMLELAEGDIIVGTYCFEDETWIIVARLDSGAET